MAQYVDKATLVEEIYKRIASLESFGSEAILHDNYPVQYAMLVTLKSLKFSINNLEVKEIKEPTASDRGMAEEIIINLKRVEQDYNIDLTREMEWLRSKEQKRE